MADQPKRKNQANVVKNADRKNGKRSKADPSAFRGRQQYRGSHNRGVKLTELEKVLLGGGALVRMRKPAPGNEPLSKAS